MYRVQCLRTLSHPWAFLLFPLPFFPFPFPFDFPFAFAFPFFTGMAAVATLVSSSLATKLKVAMDYVIVKFV